MSKQAHITRRHVLAGLAGTSAAVIMPSAGARAAITGPIKVGGLLPMTGAGGIWGPSIATIYQTVIGDVNAAGGVGGQKVEAYFEDDQTNPDAGVLAVRKLIDVNGVCCILGTWTSAVAAPVLPICWQNKVAMLTMAASDSLADLPHQGYFIRTNVHVALQGKALGEFTTKKGLKNVFVMLAQTPFSAALLKGIADEVTPNGVKVNSLVYDGRKTSFRSEVDQALAVKPDLIILGGYPQENVVLMKDFYRAGYEGTYCGIATGITSQFIAGAGKDLVEGLYSVQASPPLNSPAYKKLQALMKQTTPDTTLCQAYDQVNLALLSIAAAQAATGTAIKDYVRKIGGPDGDPVDNAVDGLKLLAQGKTINYDGASGPCEFQANGNIARADFRTLQIKNGDLVPV